jgi:hypothetical protein
MPNKLCFVCNTEIIGDHKMFSLDKPYANLFCHEECYSIIDMAYLHDNYDKILAYAGKLKQFSNDNPDEKKHRRTKGAPKLLDHEENI